MIHDKYNEKPYMSQWVVLELMVWHNKLCLRSKERQFQKLFSYLKNSIFWNRLLLHSASKKVFKQHVCHCLLIEVDLVIYHIKKIQYMDNKFCMELLVVKLCIVASYYRTTNTCKCKLPKRIGFCKYIVHIQIDQNIFGNELNNKS